MTIVGCLGVFLIIQLYSIIMSPDDSPIIYDVEYKNNLTFQEAMDSLILVDSSLKKSDNVSSYFIPEIGTYVYIDDYNNNRKLSIYGYNITDQLKKQYFLIPLHNKCSKFDYIYSIWSNYFITHDIQRLTEKIIINRIAIKYNQISPKRNGWWWFGRWCILLSPILITLILCFLGNKLYLLQKNNNQLH